MPSKFYLCALGDAFISRRILTKQFDSLLLLLENENIDYCNLLPRSPYAKTNKIDERIRKIHSTDRYSYSFICFIATKDFIDKEFSDTITDMDFECKHLIAKDGYYHENATIVIKNEFHIEPGIVKGCWVGWIYRRIKRYNPEIKLNNRPMLGWRASIYHLGSNTIAKYMPNSIRRFIKKIVLKITRAQGTEY